MENKQKASIHAAPSHMPVAFGCLFWEGNRQATVRAPLYRLSSGCPAVVLALSQPGVLSGTASIVASAASCYTDVGGNVVGLPDPLALPIVSTNMSGEFKDSAEVPREPDINFR
jgi:hypothetical protein